MSKDNPWKTLSTKSIYENAWISVAEDQVVHPKGTQGIYGRVHFKNKAVGILPLFENGDILLVGQYRYVLQRYSWEIPEGGAPSNEEPLLAAQRELREETGYMASHWEKILETHISNSVTDEVSFSFIAKDLIYDGAPSPEESEELEVKRISFEEALSMVDRGEITDALSILTLLQAERLRR